MSRLLSGLALEVAVLTTSLASAQCCYSGFSLDCCGGHVVYYRPVVWYQPGTCCCYRGNLVWSAMGSGFNSGLSVWTAPEYRMHASLWKVGVPVYDGVVYDNFMSPVLKVEPAIMTGTFESTQFPVANPPGIYTSTAVSADPATASSNDEPRLPGNEVTPREDDVMPRNEVIDRAAREALDEIETRPERNDAR